MIELVTLPRLQPGGNSLVGLGQLADQIVHRHVLGVIRAARLLAIPTGMEGGKGQIVLVCDI